MPMRFECVVLLDRHEMTEAAWNVAWSWRFHCGPFKCFSEIHVDLGSHFFCDVEDRPCGAGPVDM
ncbi:hypothetical protein D9M68_884670 [compost metagenome]